MTVEEYRDMPEARDAMYELVEGEVVSTPWPKVGGLRLRHRLRELLETLLGNEYVVIEGVPFRSGNNLRAAVLSAVAKEQWDNVADDDDLRSAPALAIEISPNSYVEKKSFFFQHGTQEFWSLDAASQEVTVSLPNGLTHTYGMGSVIPLAAFGAEPLAVAAIF